MTGNYFSKTEKPIKIITPDPITFEKAPKSDKYSHKPLLSVVVIVYDMPEQSYNTLLSLSADYQRNVSSHEYEVIVIENNSRNTLPADAIARLPPNFSYHLREETGVSPAPAINQALSISRGQYIGLLIDGARMLTPKVIQYALQGLKLADAIVAVPGYYLSTVATTSQNCADILLKEKKLLRDIDWINNGYRLFEKACFSNGNRHGYFHPLMECNALFFSKHAIDSLGGVDEAFNLKGGGSLNLHLYRLLNVNTKGPLVILPGEGNFHQFHGGTSTTNSADRKALVETFKTQLDSYWPGGFKAVTKEPYMLGSISREALPFMRQSLEKGDQRFKSFQQRHLNPWQDGDKLETSNE